MLRWLYLISLGAAVLATVSTARAQTVLLSDNFDVAGALTANLGTRQAGTLAGTSYTFYSSSSAYNVTGGRGVVYAPSASNLASFSPQHDFTEDPGLGNYFYVSVDIGPNVPVGVDAMSWAAISVGEPNALLGWFSGGWGSRVGFGAFMRPAGSFNAHDGSSSVATSGVFTSSPAPGALYNFELRIYDPIDGNPFDGSNDATCELYSEGSLLWTYVKPSGFTSNYITLLGTHDSGYSDGYHSFDNHV